MSLGKIDEDRIKMVPSLWSLEVILDFAKIVISCYWALSIFLDEVLLKYIGEDSLSL